MQDDYENIILVRTTEFTKIKIYNFYDKKVFETTFVQFGFWLKT